MSLQMRNLWLLVLALVVGAGCATYSDTTRAARESLARGNLEGGEKKLNDLLKVDSSRELPAEWDGETALTLLERATVLQALRDYSTSARDFSVVDKELELLDIANDDVGSIGKYLYSDDSTKYKAAPTEKMLLNAFNMVNYLARGDLQGASVEARRFTVIRKYLNDNFPEETHGAFGSYLAGFTFEMRGDYDVALRYYDEVLQQVEAPSLHETIRRLAPRSHYRTPRITAILDKGGAVEASKGGGEILVVLKTGSVPVKEAVRIPIGAALGLASNYVSGDTKVLEYGLFKVVSYPELKKVPQTFRGGSLHVSGSRLSFDPITDIEKEILHEYEVVKPKIVGAAITRMITRAVAAEGARYAGRQKSGGLGFLAAALVEGTMVALDKPDTRSWSTLPSQVWITRIPVEAGSHQVEVDLRGPGGARLSRTVEVPEGGFAVVDFTTLR